MIIGGVDLGGRKAALSIFSDGELTTVQHLELPRSTRSVELRTLAEWTYGYLKVANLILVEEPLVGRGPRASLQVAQTAGAVMAKFGGTDWAQKSDFVTNKTWKRVVIGNGNANKQTITNWLSENHPSYSVLCGSNQDRRDAVCIGLYGVQLARRAAQLEAL